MTLLRFRPADTDRARFARCTVTVLTVLTVLAASSAAPSPLTAQRVDRRAILAELDRYIPSSLAQWNGAGVAVGIVENDSLIYAKGFGVREVGQGDPIDAGTLFAIGSNSKFFTAVAAGMLADDGTLSLDDRITKFLPEFQLYDPWVTREFTLRDAMSHRSGLGRRGDPLWYGTPYSRSEIIRRVRYLVPNSSFRTEYGYQNIMFLSAGEALAAASGKSWDDLIRDRIFQPLGMSASNTSVKQLAGRANVAMPHRLDPGATRPVPIPYLDIDNVAPAGSINSNVQDMARWMRFILAGGSAGGRQLLKSATLADITGPHSIATRVVADTLNPTRHFSLYALGIGVSDLLGVKVLQHTGGIDGMLSYVAMVPERKLGIVVLTNTAGHNALYTALGSRILNDFLGGPTRDWSAIALQQVRRVEEASAKRARDRYASRIADAKPSLPLAEYVGTYRHEMYGDATVALEAGALRVRYPSAIDLQLRHLHYDVFLGAPPSTPPDSPEGAVIRFMLDAQGRIASVDVEGVAEFSRVRGQGNPAR